MSIDWSDVGAVVVTLVQVAAFLAVATQSWILVRAERDKRRVHLYLESSSDAMLKCDEALEITTEKIKEGESLRGSFLKPGDPYTVCGLPLSEARICHPLVVDWLEIDKTEGERVPVFSRFFSEPRNKCKSCFNPYRVRVV